MRALLAALVAATALAVPAHADVTQPGLLPQYGQPCLLDHLLDDDVVLSAPPLRIVDEDDPSVVRTATVSCGLHAGYDHSAPVLVSATGPASAGVVALPPTPATVPWRDDPVGLCARVDVAGQGSLYWHEPTDRNADGHWTTDPHARCDSLWETSDLRLQDGPLGIAFATAFTVLGEVPEASRALCDAELVCSEEDPGLTTFGTVSFLRTTGGAVVRRVPDGWGCVDVHTGTPVVAGGPLTTPDPGIECGTQACSWQELSAYLVPTTLGRVSVTQACGAKSNTRVLTAAQGRVVEHWSGTYQENGEAQPAVGTFRCGAVEDTPAEPSYVVSCLAD